MRRRVVITGLGAITPLGLTVPDLWNGLLAGKSGACTITRFDPSAETIGAPDGLPATIAAEVKNFEPLNYMEKKVVKRTDLHHRYALAAAKEAFEDSELPIGKHDPERYGCIIGTANGGGETLIKNYETFMKKGRRFVSPFLLQMMFCDAAPSLISIKYDLMGPNYVIVSTCASGSHAIGSSLRAIQYDEADVMITGGTESPITFEGIGGYCIYKAISTRNDEPERASRPFDRDRDGFVLGEGAAILILEELEYAKKRGAKIYAEIVGYGTSSDAYHLTMPHPEGRGAALGMKLAIKDAGLKPDDIDYLNAHGTATPLGDPAETKAIKAAFGEHAYKFTINSSKSCIGHLLGAAGAIEALITALSVNDNKIHPTINLDNPDEECDLNYSANRVTEKEINYALTNSAGFGGHNAALVLKKYQE